MIDKVYPRLTPPESQEELFMLFVGMLLFAVVLVGEQSHDMTLVTNVTPLLLLWAAKAMRLDVKKLPPLH